MTAEMRARAQGQVPERAVALEEARREEVCL